MDTSRNYAGQDYHVPTAETTNAPQNPSFLCVIEHHDAPNLQLFHIAYYCFVYIYLLHLSLVVANCPHGIHCLCKGKKKFRLSTMFYFFYLSLTDCVLFQQQSSLGNILGTTNPLVINITIENQWVYLFYCQS